MKIHQHSFDNCCHGELIFECLSQTPVHNHKTTSRYLDVQEDPSHNNVITSFHRATPMQRICIARCMLWPGVCLPKPMFYRDGWFSAQTVPRIVLIGPTGIRTSPKTRVHVFLSESLSQTIFSELRHGTSTVSTVLDLAHQCLQHVAVAPYSRQLRLIKY